MLKLVENVCEKETKGFIVYKEELHMTEVKTITTEDEEVAAGKIPEAVHIKMGDIPHKVDFFNKENEYIFICRSGMRSENVCHYLNEQGFKTVNMVGGMLQYEGETK